jgi:hypothetical protein
MAGVRLQSDRQPAESKTLSEASFVLCHRNAGALLAVSHGGIHDVF